MLPYWKSPAYASTQSSAVWPAAQPPLPPLDPELDEVLVLPDAPALDEPALELALEVEVPLELEAPLVDDELEVLLVPEAEPEEEREEVLVLEVEPEDPVELECVPEVEPEALVLVEVPEEDVPWALPLQPAASNRAASNGRLGAVDLNCTGHSGRLACPMSLGQADSRPK